LCDEPVIPPHKGIRSGKRCDLFETLATKRVGECGEAATLGIGEPQSLRTECSFENAVFFLKVSDHLLLVLLDPASDHRDQEMENHSCSSGRQPWRDRAIQYTPTLSNFNRVEAAEIFNHTASEKAVYLLSM
jgi:hypothetical protein